MTINELESKLQKLDPNLEIIRDNYMKSEVLVIKPDLLAVKGQYFIYDFSNKRFIRNGLLEWLNNNDTFAFDKMQSLLNRYWYGSKETQTISNDSKSKNGLTMGSTEITLNDNQTKNPFKKYTDHLAETLQSKNVAYGDSFTKSVEDYGLKVIGIRLSDKYNRIKHLVNAGELKENDESLEDTLLDMAGYSILSLKYLNEHKEELENGKDD